LSSSVVRHRPVGRAHDLRELAAQPGRARLNLEKRFMQEIKDRQRTWLVTGVAGFIGSNLLESLLRLGQRVVGLDNFSTGFQRNLDQVEEAVGAEAWSRFEFVEGDIRDLETCRRVCEGVEIV